MHYNNQHTPQTKHIDTKSTSIIEKLVRTLINFAHTCYVYDTIDAYPALYYPYGFCLQIDNISINYLKKGITEMCLDEEPRGCVGVGCTKYIAFNIHNNSIEIKNINLDNEHYLIEKIIPLLNHITNHYMLKLLVTRGDRLLNKYRNIARLLASTIDISNPNHPAIESYIIPNLILSKIAHHTSNNLLEMLDNPFIKKIIMKTSPHIRLHYHNKNINIDDEIHVSTYISTPHKISQLIISLESRKSESPFLANDIRVYIKKSKTRKTIFIETSTNLLSYHIYNIDDHNMRRTLTLEHINRLIQLYKTGINTYITILLQKPRYKHDISLKTTKEECDKTNCTLTIQGKLNINEPLKKALEQLEPNTYYNIIGGFHISPKNEIMCHINIQLHNNEQKNLEGNIRITKRKENTNDDQTLSNIDFQTIEENTIAFNGYLDPIYIDLTYLKHIINLVINTITTSIQTYPQPQKH